MSNNKQKSRTFEIKTIVTASNEKTIEDFIDLKKDILSGKLQREMLKEKEGIDKVVITFTELKPIELSSNTLCVNCDESKSTHNICMDCIIKVGKENIYLPSDNNKTMRIYQLKTPTEFLNQIKGEFTTEELMRMYAEDVAKRFAAECVNEVLDNKMEVSNALHNAIEKKYKSIIWE